MTYNMTDIVSRIHHGTKLHFSGDNANEPGVFTATGRVSFGTFYATDPQGRECVLQAALLQTARWAFLADYVQEKRERYQQLLLSIYSDDDPRVLSSLRTFDENHAELVASTIRI